MHAVEIEREFKALIISSKMFGPRGNIPARYTCEGLDINPPIDIGDIPEEVRSLALIIDDPDAPGGTWLHWSVWNIPVTHHLKENEVPGLQGLNDFGKCSYGGPCPPLGTHHYFFRVYGLDDLLNLEEGASRMDLEDAMRTRILAYGELVGVYKKSKKRSAIVAR
jgi:hypothetical protein